MITEYTIEFWDKKFTENKIGWDIGYASPPLVEYFENVENKNLKILIPGAGNAHEAEHLHKKGFMNIFMNDFSNQAIKSFKKRYPHFPDSKIINTNFFDINETFDIIVEQTFFTSFHPTKREDFVKKIHSILKPGGKYLGLFFNHEFGNNYPPFGATEEIYRKLFSLFFKFKIFEPAKNSIKPRKKREIFFIFEKIN
ncbi:MAG: methyltransferase domain-containing protein [Bacteroidales bacterium]|nr:methyltransferase domain-containing protein [Bacteroidales bacterium]